MGHDLLNQLRSGGGSAWLREDTDPERSRKRFDSDPNYLYSDYWEDIRTLEQERAERFQGFVSDLAAIKAPLTFEDDEKAYINYLRREVALQREIARIAGLARDAARVDENDDSWNAAYDGAVQKAEAFSGRGFLSGGRYIDFLTEKTECIEAI